MLTLTTSVLSCIPMGTLFSARSWKSTLQITSLLAKVESGGFSLYVARDVQYYCRSILDTAQLTNTSELYANYRPIVVRRADQTDRLDYATAYRTFTCIMTNYRFNYPTATVGVSE